MSRVDGLSWQASLFAAEAPSVDAEFGSAARTDLDPAGESWVEHASRWVANPDALFAAILADAPWEGHDRWMYDRRVAEPRLRAPGWEGRPALVDEMAALLGGRHGVEFTSVGFNLYRGGDDSVAWHGDRVARDLPAAVVAIVSLGGRRRFLLRPKGGGPSVRLDLASGDLLVMGGACQRLWDHSVPKVRAGAEPRISVTFRHAYER
jgi:alkylated DNA repair dioxygenase AlkB